MTQPPDHAATPVQKARMMKYRLYLVHGEQSARQVFCSPTEEQAENYAEALRNRAATQLNVSATDVSVNLERIR